MTLYGIDGGIKFPETINYLPDMDFHSIILIVSVNSFQQLIADDVVCRHYHINADIIVPLLNGLFNDSLCFLQHHCKIDSMHLINYATNYSRCKSNIGLEMMVRINFLIWCFCHH